MLNAFTPTQRWMIYYAIAASISLRAARIVRKVRVRHAGGARRHMHPADVPMPVWERGLVLTIYGTAFYLIATLVLWEALPRVRSAAGEYPPPPVVALVYGTLLVPSTLLLAVRSWHAVRGHRARVFGRHSHL